MREYLATTTGAALVKRLLEQGLSPEKGALEDYVKDVLKDCLKSGEH